MKSLWLTSDHKPFIAAGWNDKLLMHAIHLDLLWGKGVYTIQSPLQPGIDGNCAVILHLHNNKPLWVMMPCGQLKSRYWICKKQPRVHNAVQKPVYPSLWCRGRCLLLRNRCYEYKLLYRNSKSNIGCSVDDPYLFHLSSSFANHGIDAIVFVGSTDRGLCVKSNTSELAYQAGKVNNHLAYVKEIQLWKTDTYFSICSPAMQQCDDGSCRTQSIVCMLDFQCVWHLCACSTSSHVINSIDYCRYRCHPGTCTCSPLMFQGPVSI